MDNSETERYMNALETELDSEKLKNMQLHKEYGQVSMFSSEQASNLIQWQLDLREELEKIDHLLKGDIIKRDEQGNEFWSVPTKKVLCSILRDDMNVLYWIREVKEESAFHEGKLFVCKIKQPDKTIMMDLDNGLNLYHQILEYPLKKEGYELLEVTDYSSRPFNDYGVQILMNIVSFYLNRNTILSNYDDETINIKMHDLGMEISDVIFMKYEEMGMDLPKKKRLYPIIVRELVDTIHSAYLRALNGGERDSLRTARHVTQSDGGFNKQSVPAPNQHKFSVMRPSTWLKA